MIEEWKVIVNPNAGINKGEKDWAEISSLLKKYDINFSHIFTKKIGDAIELTKEFIKEGYRKFIAVGGDGTLNEVVNGIFIQDFCSSKEITLASIGIGTGNDWGKTYNLPTNYEELIKIIKTGNTFIQDIGTVEFSNNEKVTNRYFINIAGMGFDASVVKRVNKEKIKGKGGTLSYLRNLLLSLIHYKIKNFEIKIDNESINGKLFSLGIGICKYNGNGMKQLPNAIPDDGLLDVTIINKIGKFSVLLNVKNLYDGTFINHPSVNTYTGKTVTLVSNKTVYLEADGETLGHSPCKFGIIPKALNVVIDKKFKP